MQWDPAVYGQFAAERSRPFVDLVARIECAAPRRVIDLGCGTGALTALLASRWPDANVEGIDSSPQMVASSVPSVPVTLGDIATWTPPDDVDVIVTNAALQWVPGHDALLASWAAGLPAGGWLAMQVPGNFDSPSHRTMRELATRWDVESVLRHDEVLSPESYASLLLSAGLVADVWETTYLHVLDGHDPVLAWLRGTGLRPLLAALSPTDGERFSAELAELLRDAYPAGPNGTVLPFRRIFAVGHRS